MKRFRFALALSAAIVLAASAAYFLGRTSQDRILPDPPPASPFASVGPLTVESAALDLGEVWEEPEFVHSLTVHNHSPREVKVTDVATSCGCVSVRPRSFSVQPGGSVRLDVTLDLTYREPRELGLEVRPFAAAVYPTVPGTRAPGERASWTLAGRVRSRVTLDVLALHFGERPVFGEPAEPRAVTATVHVPAKGVKVKMAEAGVAAGTRPLDPDERRYAIEVTPDTKSQPPGPFKTTATVSVVPPAGETYFGARLPVEGVVRPEARLLPARLILGPRPVGETATGTLVVQGGAAKDLAVEQVETDSPDLRITPTVVEGAPGARAFRVTQRVTQPGDQSATARFVFVKGGRQITTSVVVSSYGEEAARTGKEQP